MNDLTSLLHVSSLLPVPAWHQSSASSNVANAKASDIYVYKQEANCHSRHYSLIHNIHIYFSFQLNTNHPKPLHNFEKFE